MLKETDNEETLLFCHIFIIGGVSIGGRAYDCNVNAICEIKILCALLLVCLCVHVKATLMVLFCMIMLNV